MICTYCNDPAYVRCRKHSKLTCGSAYCTNLHRWGRGDCEFVAAQHPLAGWPIHVISFIVALAVGSLLVWIVKP